jgi:hypothetical protein
MVARTDYSYLAERHKRLWDSAHQFIAVVEQRYEGKVVWSAVMDARDRLLAALEGSAPKVSQTTMAPSQIDEAESLRHRVMRGEPRSTLGDAKDGEATNG